MKLMKHEHNEGPKAREDFERTMMAPFQFKKSDLKQAPKPKPKRKKKGND